MEPSKAEDGTKSGARGRAKLELKVRAQVRARQSRAEVDLIKMELKRANAKPKA